MLSFHEFLLFALRGIPTVAMSEAENLIREPHGKNHKKYLKNLTDTINILKFLNHKYSSNILRNKYLNHKYLVKYLTH